MIYKPYGPIDTLFYGWPDVAREFEVFKQNKKYRINLFIRYDYLTWR